MTIKLNEKEKVLVAEMDECHFCCGVLEVGSFLYDYTEYYEPLVSRMGFADRSGTGYYIATFIDEPECKEAYDILKQHKDIVFQSKPRKNRRSGNEVFIVIYQDKE